MVDDSSTDKSLEIIENFQKKDKRIVVLKNGRNLGAAASRNKAIKKVKGSVVVFLDNDTEVRKDWIENIIKPILKDESIGAAQALFLDFERRDLIQMAGGLLIPYTGWLLPFYQWEKYDRKKFFNNERKIVAISAALAVRKTALIRIRGFDEKEVGYTEDLDLSWRLWIAGYHIKLARHAIVYHHTKSTGERVSMNTNNFKIYYHLAKNSFRSIIKNYELKNVFLFLPASIFINLLRGLLVLIRRKHIDALYASVNAVGWNILHFKDTLNERRYIQKIRMVNDQELMSTIFIKDDLLSIYKKYFHKSNLLW